MNQDNTLCGSVANLALHHLLELHFSKLTNKSNVRETDHGNAWLLTTPPLKLAEAGGEGRWGLNHFEVKTIEGCPLK